MARTAVQKMIASILRLEADGGDHTGVEIDQHLAKLASALGFSPQELLETHGNNRGKFANLGDWAKARMTGTGLHEDVGTSADVDVSGRRTQCKVYRITQKGRDELSSRSRR
jgi:hypothetical protein